jgi:hypothetical protein
VGAAKGIPRVEPNLAWAPGCLGPKRRQSRGDVSDVCSTDSRGRRVFIVRRSHTYYKNTKVALHAFEECLQLPRELRIQTTPGMREARDELPIVGRVKVVHAVQLVLCLYLAIDLLLLWAL